MNWPTAQLVSRIIRAHIPVVEYKAKHTVGPLPVKLVLIFLAINPGRVMPQNQLAMELGMSEDTAGAAVASATKLGLLRAAETVYDANSFGGTRYELITDNVAALAAAGASRWMIRHADGMRLWCGLVARNRWGKSYDRFGPFKCARKFERLDEARAAASEVRSRGYACDVVEATLRLGEWRFRVVPSLPAVLPSHERSPYGTL